MSLKKKKIYLANPYGFSTSQKLEILPKIKKELESLNLEVLEPFERNEPDFDRKNWAHDLANKNFDDIIEADAIFAVVNGNPPDEGVNVEIGIAIGLGKTYFLFRDDFRKCSDSDIYPLNLMLFTGIPGDVWKDYYYTDINEIASNKKALYRWSSYHYVGN